MNKVMSFIVKPFLVLGVSLFSVFGFGQKVEETILLKDFCPKSIHNVQVTKVKKAKYPIIDMHAHDYAANVDEIKSWVETMDAVGVVRTHLMSCSWIGLPFEQFVEKYASYKDRFAFWCSFDYTGFNDDDWTERALMELEKAHRLGAVGVGEMGDKGLGDLYGWPTPGEGVHLDDPKLKPLFTKCAELNMPISVHIAEPIWMYEPVDQYNDGLLNGATWTVDTTVANCLGYDGLINTFERAVAQNPKTKFIACHYLNMSHDFKRLGVMMDKYPNMYVDISARIAESACAPRSAREFIIKYADRILFGTDNGMSQEMYESVFRVLETNDEHFYLPELGYHWYLSGFNLPNDVLKKIYYKNAEKLMRK